MWTLRPKCGQHSFLLVVQTVLRHSLFEFKIERFVFDYLLCFHTGNIMGCDVTAVLIVPIELQHLLSDKTPRSLVRSGKYLLICICFLLFVFFA